jgi:hypothetical protein
LLSVNITAGQQKTLMGILVFELLQGGMVCETNDCLGGRMVAAAQAAKQKKHDQHDDQKPEDASKSPAAVISLAVTVKTAPAEQQDQYDNDDNERHWSGAP